MHEQDPGCHPPRRHHRRARPHRPGGHRPPGRHLELPRLRLTAVPRRDLRLAELDGRARRPERRHRAARGRHRLHRLRRDRRRLARRRRLHRPASARPTRSSCGYRGHRGSLDAAIAAMVAGNRIGDIGHAVRPRRRRGWAWSRATPATPSAGHARAAQRPEPGHAGHRREAARRQRARHRADAGAGRPRDRVLDDDWTVVTAAATGPPTPSTPSPSRPTVPRSSPSPDPVPRAPRGCPRRILW